MCLCCKKTKLVYDIYYCFTCKRYFKSQKEYNKHMNKYHKFDYLNIK